MVFRLMLDEFMYDCYIKPSLLSTNVGFMVDVIITIAINSSHQERIGDLLGICYIALL